MIPKPRYPIGVENPNSTVHLTDGLYSSGEGQSTVIWRNPLTVGWMLAEPPIVIIDLKKHHAITGASYSTAAGHGGVTWPQQIPVLTSDDKETWRFCGDLVKLSDAPPQENENKGEAILWRYRTDALRGQGRYIAFAIQPVISKENYVFCDEIEVYGSEAPAEESSSTGELLQGNGIRAIRDFMLKHRVAFGIEGRLTKDLAILRERLKTATVSNKEALSKDANAIEAEIATLPLPDPETFKAVYPINSIHEKLLGIFGHLLKSANLPSLVMTHAPRYELQKLFPTPEDVSNHVASSLNIRLMRNESRAEALLLTNATSTPLETTIEIEEQSGDQWVKQEAPWLKISVVPWTDTLQLQPVATALLPQKAGEPLVLQPGLSTKLWLEVDASLLPAGTHQRRISIAAGGEVRTLPLSIQVSRLAMKRPRLALGTWDYTDPEPSLGLTPQNVQQARELMRSHHVNVTWANRKILPWPEAGAFNKENQLAQKPDFTALEAWKAHWPEARFFCIFIHAKPEFAGASMETPVFNTRLASWAAALESEAKALGMSDSLILQLVDEPHNEKQDQIIIAWAKAIREGAPGLRLVENPTWLRPDQSRYQAAVTLPHILMPYVVRYLEGGKPVEHYFERRRASGQKLWFYQCSGPVRLLDPTQYYRSLAWWAFMKKAEAINIWAFADVGVGGQGKDPGSGNSWNEYAGNNFNYSPVFFTPTSLTNTLHWQATKEGIQDHEYLAMLQDQADTHPEAAWHSRATALLEEAPEAVVHAAPLETKWQESRSADFPDQWRIKILDLLEEITPP